MFRIKRSGSELNMLPSVSRCLEVSSAYLNNFIEEGSGSTTQAI